MKNRNIMKKILICFICIALVFSNVSLPVNAAGALAKKLVKEFFEGVGWTLLWNAASDVGNAIYDKVDDWFNGEKLYYNVATEHGGGGHRREPKYYDNNDSISDAMNNYYNDDSITNNQQFIDNSTTNQYTYTTYSSSVADNRTYSLIKDSFNLTTNTYTTLLYNPVTNNYTEVNNVYYNNQYDTYYITNNEYNYYVTNNYTYVSYYIINNETNEETYHEIYYEMPDGRNSYYLEKEDIWGEYFIYDVANYELVAEDDGTTLALYHLDGNLKDSSYWVNTDLSGGSGSYSSSKFGNGYYVNDNTFLYYPDNLDMDNFTLEFIMSFTVNSSKISNVIPKIFLNSTFYYLNELNSGVYYFVIQVDNGELSCYVNGKKQAIQVEHNDSIDANTSSFMSFNSDRIRFGVIGKAYFSHNDGYFDYYESEKVPYILDEVRISNRPLYSGDSISIPSQPFDTNMVLVVPENPTEDMIAIRGNYDIGSWRIGGVRPTYASAGDVYIYLENDVVKDVQQYEGDAWYSVVGAIYQDGEWHDLKEFDMSTYTFDEEDDSGGSGSDGSGSGGSVSDNDTGTGSGNLLDGIMKIFDVILSLIGKLMGVVADFAQSILDLFSGFTTFTDGFSDFLTGAFGFIPPEIWNIIKAGLSLMVMLAVIKFLRK